MKKLVLFLSLISCIYTAQAQISKATVSSMITTATAPIISVNKLQDVKINKSVTDITALQKLTSSQSATITDQAAGIKRMIADSIAKKWAIDGLTDFYRNLNTRLYVAEQKNTKDSAQILSLISQNDSIRQALTGFQAALALYIENQRVSDSTMQEQINDAQSFGVKALIEANRKDSIDGMPGQINITKMAGGFRWEISPELMARILKIEAKLPTTK